MKSHVSMERRKCLVCTKDFETNAILLHKRLRPVLDNYTLTGWGLCPEDQKKFDDGYIALVGADVSKSGKLPNGTIKPSDAYRTGEIVHIRLEAFARVFNVPAEGEDGTLHALMFVEPAVIEWLKAKAEEGPKV